MIQSVFDFDVGMDMVWYGSVIDMSIDAIMILILLSYDMSTSPKKSGLTKGFVNHHCPLITNHPLIRPYFRWGWHWGVPLDSRDYWVAHLNLQMLQAFQHRPRSHSNSDAAKDGRNSETGVEHTVGSTGETGVSTGIHFRKVTWHNAPENRPCQKESSLPIVHFQEPNYYKKTMVGNHHFPRNLQQDLLNGPEKTWVCNSSIATYWTGSVGILVPFNFWWTYSIHLKTVSLPIHNPMYGTELTYTYHENQPQMWENIPSLKLTACT